VTTNKTGNVGKAFLKSLRDSVLTELKHLGAYVFYSAATGSQYIKFADPRVGSLRVGDHKGIEKYKYKWNLSISGKRRDVSTGKSFRKYYPADDLLEMCSDIRAHRREILEKYGPYDVAKDRFSGSRNISMRRYR